MAVRLYPPNIAGILPSFYENEKKKGTAILAVPFSSNRTVGKNAAKAMSLKIKTSYTDKTIGIVNDGEIINTNAVFTIQNDIFSRLKVGEFYKIQIAYIGDQDVIGYYSTVAVIKFTSSPSIYIANFSSATTNVNPESFRGIYSNIKDQSEHSSQYKFVLYDSDDNVLESTGWKVHSVYNDELPYQSEDTYNFKYAIKDDVKYKVQYSVLTNNSLEVKSPMYVIQHSDILSGDIENKLYVENNYENGCIKLYIKEALPVGQYLIERANSKNNFTSWSTILNLTSSGNLEGLIFQDFTVEQGITYRYSIQKFNSSGVYTRRSCAEDIVAEFEDAFLYDGEKQLKIRFNPKVSSFKTTILETKKNTIGGKYPYIFRNGQVGYKEFPISGLLSYLSDNDKLFASKEELLMGNLWEDTTNATDENITVERQFKLIVLDWLNDGKQKLFRSPYEGNYIVRLMNVSLSPIETVGRMLHTFSCNACEIEKFSNDNVNENFATGEDIVLDQKQGALGQKEEQINISTTILQNLVDKAVKSTKDDWEAAKALLLNKNIISQKDCYYIKITNVPFGLKFLLDDEEIMIGATGQYEAYLEEPITSIKFADENQLDRYNMRGEITYGVAVNNDKSFDMVSKVIMREYTAIQAFGPSDNIFELYADGDKYKISNILYANFTKIPVYEISDKQSLSDLNHIEEQVIYHAAKDDKYYKVSGKDIIEIDNYSTEIIYGDTKIDISQTGHATIPSDIEIQNSCKIGSGVSAVFGIQIQEISYDFENTIKELSELKNEYSEINRKYCIYKLGLVENDNPDKITNTINGEYEIEVPWIYENDQMVVIDDDGRAQIRTSKIRYYSISKDEDVVIQAVDFSQVLEAKKNYLNKFYECKAEKESE